jgi:phospholipid N-methyltransferase
MSAFAPLRFFTESLRNQKVVGSLWPSSKGLSRAMVAPIFAESIQHRDKPLRVLEVGAGVGPITSELVDRLLPGDVFDVVELSPDFCQLLRDRFGAGAVVPTIHEVSILDYDPGYRYDHVVSGLPLANFSSAMVEQIYDQYFRLLEPGGTLIMFKYILGREALRTFGVGDNRKRAARLMELERELDRHQVDLRTVPLNFPPAHVVVRQKPLD